MALSQKFRDAVSGAALNVSALDTDTRYPLLYCDRVETKYGAAVRLAIREDGSIVKVFYRADTVPSSRMRTCQL